MKDQESKVVAIVLRSHPSMNMGGAPYQAGIIAEQLAKNTKHKIFYLANRIVNSEDVTGYSKRQISDPKHWLYRRSLIFDGLNLWRALKKINPDVIYQNALTAHTGYAALYAKIYGKKFIYHVASDYDLLPKERFQEKIVQKILERFEKKMAGFAYRIADHVLVQTKRQADLLDLNYGRSDGVLFPNLLPAPTSKAVKADKVFRVVWIANFKPIKQPELFVQLARSMEQHSRVEFKMIGRPSLNLGYQYLLDEIEALSNIEFLGELTIAEVNEVLSSSHVLVNTSITEGYSNTFVQAWMRGVAVVSLNADIDGTLESLELGMLGKDLLGVKNALVVLNEDSDKRAAIARRAVEYTHKNNTLGNIEKLINLL